MLDEQVVTDSLEKAKITQESLVREFYENRPNEDITVSEAVDWIMAEYRTRTGKRFWHPDSTIRKLCQRKFLVKVARGVYRYSP